MNQKRLINFKNKLTNLELLSFLTVLAFPKASRMGLVWTTWSSRDALPDKAFPVAPTDAKYPMTFFVFSVFPAPDSPLQISQNFTYQHLVSISSMFYRKLLHAHIPKAKKKTIYNLTVFFALFGSARIKAAHKTFMKLTPEAIHKCACIRKLCHSVSPTKLCQTLPVQYSKLVKLLCCLLYTVQQKVKRKPTAQKQLIESWWNLPLWGFRVYLGFGHSLRRVVRACFFNSS
jgi:hypothetical protein